MSIQRTLELYFTERNRQIEIVQRAQKKIERARELYTKANEKLEAATKLYEEIQPFEDVASEINLGLSDEILSSVDNEEERPITRDSAVRKLMAAASLPKDADVRRELEAYADLYNEQLKLKKEIARAYNEAFDIYDVKMSKLMEQAEEELSGAEDAIYTLEIYGLSEVELEQAFEGHSTFEILKPRDAATRVLKFVEDGVDEDHDEDDDEDEDDEDEDDEDEDDEDEDDEDED